MDSAGERCHCQRVNFSSPAPSRDDQSRVLKRVQMSCDALARKRHRVNVKQSGTQFKQSLIIAFAQFIQDEQARIVAKRAKEFAQTGVKWDAHTS